MDLVKAARDAFRAKLRPDLDTLSMHDAVVDTINKILNDPTPTVELESKFANVAAPSEQDELGNVRTTYLVIPKIPAGVRPEGREEVMPWVETDPGDPGNGIAPTGTAKTRETYEADFDIHQVGGNGEKLQKLRLSLCTQEMTDYMKALGLVFRRSSEVTPSYSQTLKTWGPDAVATFTFAGSFALDQTFAKVTDVKTSLNGK